MFPDKPRALTLASVDARVIVAVLASTKKDPPTSVLPVKLMALTDVSVGVSVIVLVPPADTSSDPVTFVFPFNDIAELVVPVDARVMVPLPAPRFTAPEDSASGPVTVVGPANLIPADVLVNTICPGADNVMGPAVPPFEAAPAFRYTPPPLPAPEPPVATLPAAAVSATPPPCAAVLEPAVGVTVPCPDTVSAVAWEFAAAAGRPTAYAAAPPRVRPPVILVVASSVIPDDDTN